MYTLLNPHADDFIAEPLSFKWAKRRALKKYSYVLSQAVSGGSKIDVLVDGTVSSLFPQTIFAKLPKVLRKLILKAELKRWVELNELQDNITLHWSPQTIKDKKVLYFLAYKNAVGPFEKRVKWIEQFDLKVINLSHFMIRTGEKAENLNKLRNVIYTSEADLTGNPFFVKHFGADQKIIVLPFAVPERFRVRKNFSERDGLCGATGSYHALLSEKPRKYYQDFLDHFKVDTYHPVRKMLFQSRDDLADILDSKVSPYRENGSSWLNRLDFTQKAYFSFDIVDFYNSHPYALIGEEIQGLPAIGAFEAMACGAVLLAQEGDYYKGLALQPGQHYVSYDGSKEDLRKKIEWLRSHPKEGEAVAQNGLTYVKEHCSPREIWLKLNSAIEAHKA